MTFKAGDTLAGYADSSRRNLRPCLPACKQRAEFACTAVALQPALPTARPGSPAGGWAGGAPDHRLVPAPVPKPALPHWISWAVAGRKHGYFWRGWLPEEGRGGGKRSPNTTSDLTAALQGPTQRDTNPAPASIQHLPSQSSLCFLSLLPSSNKISSSHEFGPLLAPTQADRAPACHLFPQPHSAWPDHLSQLDPSTLPRALAQGVDPMWGQAQPS